MDCGSKHYLKQYLSFVPKNQTYQIVNQTLHSSLKKNNVISDGYFVSGTMCKSSLYFIENA